MSRIGKKPIQVPKGVTVAVKSGGVGGTALRVPDAWLSCEYQ